MSGADVLGNLRQPMRHGAGQRLGGVQHRGRELRRGTAV